MRAWLTRMHEKYPTATEVVRFLIVGGLATAVDYVVMALVGFLMEPELYTDFLSVFTAESTGLANAVGTACGFSAGLLVNYLLSVFFVFEHKGRSRSPYGFAVFTALSLIGMGIRILGVYVGATVLGFNKWAVTVVMTVLVLIYNYLSKRLILFRDRKKAADAEDRGEGKGPSGGKGEE